MATYDLTTNLVTLVNLAYSSGISTRNSNWVSESNTTITYGSDGTLIMTPTNSSLLEGYIRGTNQIAYIQGHKYYCAVKMKGSIGQKYGQIYFPYLNPYPSSAVSIGTDWTLNSFISADNTIASGNYYLRLDNDNSKTSNVMTVKELIVVDLTAIYGSGNEPSKSWCDKNIPFFEGSMTLSKNLPNSFANGDIINCPYSGTVKGISLGKGIYKLEVWGASGQYTMGSPSSTSNSPYYAGAYGRGTFEVKSSKQDLYLCVGETAFNKNTLQKGCFNGGGAKYSTDDNGEGGGATHISTKFHAVAVDSYYRYVADSNGLNSRLLVAGGGGNGRSTASDMYAGYAPSYTTASGYSGYMTSSPSQSAGAIGGFGYGGSCTSTGDTASSGGGGWYGGGSPGDSYGGGGSSFAWCSTYASYVPGTWMLDTTYYLTDVTLICAKDSMPDFATTNTVVGNQMRDGYARITVIKASIFDTDPNFTGVFPGYRIELSWTNPAVNSVSLGNPTQLYKNGILLSSNVTTSFIDNDISLNQTYTYKLRWNNNDEYIVETTISTPGNLESTTNFGYEGSIKTFNFLAGKKYKLEAWGAEGGSTYYSSSTYTVYGGKGGYSVAEYTPGANTTGYIAVGQQPPSMYSGQTSPNAGGYNGGGSGAHAGGGGGASHIALTTGLLSTLSANIANILLVAGAGGGASMYPISDVNTYNQGLGGAGGGTIGGDGKWVTNWWNNASYYGRGGTQSAGGTNGATASPTYGMGSFGLGGTYTGNPYTGGGGAGFYGGGSGYSNGDGGGGGSGYIGALTVNGATSRGDTVFKSPAGTNVTGNSGNGYVRISTYGTDKWYVSGITISYKYYKLRMTWNALVSGQKVVVYRSVNGEAYKVVNTDGLISPYGYTVFEDKNITAGNTYSYKMKYIYQGYDVYTEVTSYTISVTPSINNFSYTGTVQSITLPKGQYKLETWGANGGGGNGITTTNLGGYSTGVLDLQTQQTVYVYVGQQGDASTNNPSRTFGGGGSCYSSNGRSMGRGGGASDIRIGTDSLYARVIVAGGGGGADYNNSYPGGAGGGTSGIAGGYANCGGTGGAPTAGGSAIGNTTSWGGTWYSGSFGLGGYGVNGGYMNGGGGGWYGGGASGPDGTSGGGSGYVYTSATASQYPGGVLLNSTYYLTSASTAAGNTTFVAPGGSNETGHIGHGYVRITRLSASTEQEFVNNFSLTNSGKKVDLAWDTTTVNNVPSCDKLNIYKNGVLLYTSSALDPNTANISSFSDTQVSFNTTYTYKIEWIIGAMTYYTSATIFARDIKVGDGNFTVLVKDFNYNGGIQSVGLEAGKKYKLETWGAQGGQGWQNASYIGTGGLGGYSLGYYQPSVNETLYAVVGSQGASDNGANTTTAGGYNGGGTGVNFAGGGGGATHLATVSGLLNTLSSQLAKILLIAAGGGGGQAYSSSIAYGGYGGGASGGYGSVSGYWGSSTSYQGYPGTQSTAGSNPSGWNTNAGFGQGGNYYSSYCGGGGAGLYGGACGGYNGAGGGGGSSYIGTLVTSGSTTANQRSGNGYARVYTETVTNVDYVKTTFNFNLSSSIDLNDRLTLTWNSMAGVANYLLYKDSRLYGSYTENTMSLLVPPDQSSTYEVFAILTNGDVYTSGVKIFAGNSSAAVNINYTRIVQEVSLLANQEQARIVLKYEGDSIIKSLLENTVLNPYRKVKVIFSWRPTENVTGRTVFADEERTKLYNVPGEFSTLTDAKFLFDLLRNYSYTFTIKIQTYSSYSSAYRTYCSYTTDTLIPEASIFNATSIEDLDCAFKKGTIISNVADGGFSKIILPPGQYMVETYGADGGTGYQNASYKGTGGKGAYSKFILTLTDIERLYLAAGLRGSDNMTDAISKGGFNGGGDGYQFCGAGGGCTSIASAPKLAKDCNPATKELLAIAGGGGGGIGYSTATPGIGGSAAQNGSDGTYCTNWSNSTMVGKGGTQSAGGINPGSNNALYNGGFGYGGRYYTSYCAGGGAGWYGGSSGGANGCAGGGGASNINTEMYSVSDIEYNTKSAISSRDGDGAIFITRLTATPTVTDSFMVDEDYESDILTLSFIIPDFTLSYEVYRKDDVNGEIKLTSDVVAEGSSGLRITYKDERFKYNKDYYYQVRYYLDAAYTYPSSMSKILNIKTPESVYTIYSSTNLDDIIVHNGTVLKYPYEGAARLTKLPAGTYNLTLKGAQGGSYSSGTGGLGGYSYGTIDTTKTESFYIYTGEQGKGGATSALAGGWNGGGPSYTANSSYYEGSGGGATDIRINSNSLYARVIVAGGGGGHGEYSGNWLAGGAGGGATAVNGAGYNASYLGGAGGSQSAGGNSYYQTTVNNTTYGSLAGFGVGGGYTTTSYEISGGGGGWYGGGYSFRSAAGGGSGYVYTSATAGNYPLGCLLNSKYYLRSADTVANVNAGNGYCEIECETLLNFDQALGLKSSLDSDSNITLTWNNITYQTLLPISFKLEKGGVTKTTVNTNTFLDTDIDWNKSYKYTVTFTFVDGTEISRSIRVNSLTSYYDLTSGVTRVIDARRNTIINCGFMDMCRQIILPPGLYKMQCWGAEGGSYTASAPAGKGGYSTGTIELLETAKFFLYTGGQGNYTSGSSIAPLGGYNGGGSSYLRYSGSGGGASDIRLGTNSLYARLLVAGGGGGSGYYNGSYYGYGGNAGGVTGSPGNNMYQSGSTAVNLGAGQGGTATAGGEGGYYSSTTYKGGNGSFGLGGNTSTQYTTAASAGGGGGGWYGGGSGGGNNDSNYYYYSSVGGGGGSSYYYAFGTTQNYPTGGLLNRNYCLSDASSAGGGSTFVGPTGVNETGHSGNGYIIITCIRPLELLTLDNQPNLRGIHYKTKNLIKWDRVLVNGTPMSYKLYRENVLIYEGTETSFKDTGIDEVTTYGYVLVIQYDNKTFKTNIVIDPATGYTYKDTFKGFYFKLNGQWYVWETE